MATGKRRRRLRRAPLNRTRVLKAALALADKEGLEGLTMRRLGDTLGVEAMSLYNHVANKEALVDGLVDMVFSEIELPCGDRDWKNAMGHRAHSARDALMRHRWAIPLMESRSNPGPANLGHHESVLRCLREAGFSLEMAGHAYSLLDSYIYGFALEQASLPFETGPQAAELARAMISQFPAGAYPYMIEFASQLVTKPGYSYAAEFEFGLSLILDGLEHALTEVPKPIRNREARPRDRSLA